MKRVLLCAAGFAACLMMLAAAAMAQPVMRVYVGDGAMEDHLALRLTEMLSREFEPIDFELTDRSEGSLRDLVLADQTPELAICSPREAAVWAKEGLILPLQKRIDDQQEIAHEVLSVCVYDENLFMAPLIAHHRQMAINVKLFEKRALGYMLDEITHPVWYPTEFQQILEEFAIADQPALDIWQAEPESFAAAEAMLQAIYCGRLLDADGKTCTVDEMSVCSGMRWLRDLKEGGMVGYTGTRQEALERFLAGETAIFIDWTKDLQRAYAKQMKEAGMIVEERPYPSSSGLPVRSYALTGVSVFDSGNDETNALTLQAAAFLHEDEQVQTLLDERGIFDDGSLWLWDLTASDHGATLRSLMCEAYGKVMEEQQDIGLALSAVKAGMDTAFMH